MIESELKEFVDAEEPSNFVPEEMKVSSPNKPKEQSKKGSILDQLTQADLNRLALLVQAQQDINRPPKIIKTQEQLEAEKKDLMTAIQAKQVKMGRRVEINYMQQSRVHFSEIVK